MNEMWEPAFPGQRPPFAEGNTSSVQHGADSAAVIVPLAASLEAEARASEWWPDRLNNGMFDDEIGAYFEAMAQVQRLREYLGGLDVEAAGTDVSEESSEEVRGKGGSQRITRTRRRAAAEGRLRQAERDAAAHRKELGLTPSSAARIGRDMATGRYLVGLTAEHPLTAALNRIRVDRELGAGSDGN